VSKPRLFQAWRRRPPEQAHCPHGVAGLSVSDDSLALAIVEHSPNGKRRLHRAEAAPLPSSGHWQEVLPALAERYALRRYPLNLVLAPADYRLLPIEAPKVPAVELRDALRWLIQDTLDFPAETAEIEYFYLPKPRHAEHSTSLVATVAPAEAIQRYENHLAEAGLQLAAIDIPELALRNLAALLPESADGVAFVALNGRRGIIQLQKNAVLYVTRSIDIGLNDLGKLAECHDIAELPALERLALEIQRSLDYFENHYGMPPAAGLVLAPTLASARLAGLLEPALGVPCWAMDLNSLIPCAEALNQASQQACLLAIGAALRQEPVPP
jgi:MSHA biogenesis protein MshI